MADILLRGLSDEITERIKHRARELGWPIQDVIVHLLKQGLGMVEPLPAPEPGDIARLRGTWDDEESRALSAAMAEFMKLPDDTAY